MELDLEGRANDRLRTLFESASCPPDLADEYDITESDIGRLLARIVWMPFDFEAEPSNRRKEGKQLSQDAIESGSPEDGTDLWSALCSIGNDLRAAAGVIDREELVGRVRPSFHLTDFPDHQADWKKLDRFTAEALDQIPHTIGSEAIGEVKLPRKEERDAIAEGFEETSILGLVGASGTGKTVIARAEAEATLEDGRVLWFNSEHLQTAGIIEWESRLDLSHSLGELIRANPNRNGLLVLDGLDQLYGDGGFARAAQLISMTAPSDPSSPWRVLITCQPEDWKRVLERLLEFEVPVRSVERVPIQKPSLEELDSVWETFPSLRPLRSRRHLTPVLLRPKILDWLTRRSQIEVDLSQVGESDLVHWFWKKEITNPEGGYVRSATAIQLAILQADRLKSSIAEATLSEELSGTHLSALEDLESDSIVVRRGKNIAFEHDLYGDWARFKALSSRVEGGNLASFLDGRIGPMWYRPLRLLGLSLLEQNDDTGRWKAVFDSVGEEIQDGGSAIAQDLLLESVAFVTKPDSSLDELWTLLTENDGELLDRLIKQLLFSATIPDPRLISAVVESEEDLEIFAAVTNRIPYAPYWIRILALLHEHRFEIPDGAQGSVAQAIGKWLQYTPEDFPLRDEAAEIAVILGEKLLQDKEKKKILYQSSEMGKSIYRAVLASGKEQPDKVCQILLEAAGRRAQRFRPDPPSEEELEQRREQVSSFPATLVGARGPRLPPWPDGPAFRPDGALQDVVLETDALHSFIQTHPKYAQELLLALLIKEPEKQSPLSGSTSPVTAHKLKNPNNWHPAFYHHGPFRSFLYLSERSAVDTILRLVGHATERHVEWRTRDMAEQFGESQKEISTPRLPILTEGEVQECLGSTQIARWNRGMGMGSTVVQCALMALEKYLYERIEAGEDPTPLIEKILSESRSVPVLGLLISIGRKKPELFRNLLLPLLTNPSLLVNYSTPTQSAWQISRLSLSEHLQQEFEEWHQHEHRNFSLLAIARYLFISDTDVRTMLEEVRERWENSDEDWSASEGLAAQFDWDNYSRVTDDEGNEGYMYEPPQHLEERAKESREESEVEARAISIPMECRSLLDGEEATDGETLDDLWTRLQELEEKQLPNEHDPIISLEDSQCGVAAVMICRGEEWLEDYPEREEWAKSTILSTGESVELEDRLYGGPTEMEYQSFIAGTLPVLWSRNPSDSRVRNVVARFLVQGHSQIVKKMVTSAKSLRGQLGEDFVRLIRVIQRRARWIEKMRQVERKARGSSITGQIDEETQAEVKMRREELSAEMETLKQEFIDQELEPDLPRIRDLLLPVESREQKSSHSGRDYPVLNLDDGLLTAAYSGLPIDPRNIAPDERDWTEDWLYAIQDTVRPLTLPEDESPKDIGDATPAWDRLVMESAALLVLKADSSSQAKEFWEPILNLGPTASNRVSWFLRDWTNYGLAQTDQTDVVETWRDMILYALDHPRWSFKMDRVRFSRGEVWRALFGFQHLSADVWSSDLRSFVRTLKPFLQSWSESHLRLPRNARKLAAFLKMPAAKPIILNGIIWIADVDESEDEWFWEDDTDDRIASLLVHAWQEAEDRLRSQEEAFSAFNDLLGKLTARQLPVALELAERVGGHSES
ncbi:ATP-binding protein [Salinibacter altiplanensis]|uniref:ATP-binding protein n=1 Tax=Salinibacter altiplanensis TaxID=1803181 RepID=UPI001E5E253D|nr:ATP-binding protein [Salinibacter altiplanensis]